MGKPAEPGLDISQDLRAHTLISVCARRSLSKTFLFSLAFLITAAVFGQQTDPETALDEATGTFEHGNPAAAEQTLDSILKKYPRNLRALVLMGAVLDSQQRFREAESWY